MYRNLKILITRKPKIINEPTVAKNEPLYARFETT
jgi:hypothetical protein